MGGFIHECGVDTCEKYISRGIKERVLNERCACLYQRFAKIFKNLTFEIQCFARINNFQLDQLVRVCAKLERSYKAIRDDRSGFRGIIRMTWG